MKIAIIELIILIALYTDLKYHKIPNLITFSGMLAGILMNLSRSLEDSLLGLFIVLACYIPVYIMGAVAAGDVKILMAVGLIMGYRFVIAAIILIVVCNLIFTAVVLIKKKSFGRVLKYTCDEIEYRFLVYFTLGKKAVIEKPRIEGKTQLPYMPAIAVGVNVAIIMYNV